MVIKKIVPYGEWASDFTADCVTQGARNLAFPRTDRNSGRSFFLESRPNGTTSIVEATADGPKHVLPDSASASTSVQESRGLPYEVVPGERLRIIFSDARDQSVNLLDVDSGAVKTLLYPSCIFRYGDFDAHPGIADGTIDTAWVLAVQQNREKLIEAGFGSSAVAININSGEARRIAQVANFYSSPRFAPDGSKIAWREWNYPFHLSWGAKLSQASWSSHGAISNVELVAGNDDRLVLVTEPRWSPGGALFFAQEKADLRQLFRKASGDAAASPVGLEGREEARVGRNSRTAECQSYAFLSGTSLIATSSRAGSEVLVYIDLETATSTKLDIGLADSHFESLAASSPCSILAVGSSPTTRKAVYRITLSPDRLAASVDEIRSSVNWSAPPSALSTPTYICIPSATGTPRDIHAVFWPPHGRHSVAPAGALPPLLLWVHSRPKGHFISRLRPGVEQYFATRGYAVVVIAGCDGSTATGRRSFESQNGERDGSNTDDVAEAARFLIHAGKVDGSRVGVFRGSAEGYVVQGGDFDSDIFQQEGHPLTRKGTSHELLLEVENFWRKTLLGK